MRLTHLDYYAGSRSGLIANVGGLAGTNAGTIKNTMVMGSVRGWNATLSGGIVGLNTGMITDSMMHGGGSGVIVGGIAGNNTGTIQRCYSGGTVRGVTKLTPPVAGGIAGENLLGTITQVYSTDKVSGLNSSTLGGVVGSNTGSVQYAYALGSVSGGNLSTAGGLVGSNSLGLISQSYSTGQVTAGALSSIGGFAGIDVSLSGIASSYWDKTTSGMTQGVGNALLGEAGVTGLTDSQLKAALSSGFSNLIWARSGSIQNSLPYLLALPPT